MQKQANPRTISLIFAGLLLVTFNLNKILPSDSHNYLAALSPFPTAGKTEPPTPSKTRTPTNTPTRTATGTLTSSRYIVLDTVDVKYPNGTSGVYVTQNNTCVSTSQGGLHCIFTGSGYTDRSLRGVQPYASFHWSDNTNAKNVYRYQVATVSHTNQLGYGNLVLMEFFGSWLTDGYHEWSGIGSYGNCNIAGCELRATFYMQGGYGTYTWSVDTYVAPVAINIYAPTVSPTSTPTRTPLPTFTPTETSTSTATSTPTITPTPTQDRWYTGNNRPFAYAINANISAPTQAPALVESGESNWVSLPKPYWIQAGWRYYVGYTSPRMYVEVNSPAGYPPPIIYGDQIWGEIVEYGVYNSYGTFWCATINNEIKNCVDLGIVAPARLYGWSEVHNNPQNGLDTYFSDVRFMDSNGVWHLFDQSNWREDFPYTIDKIQNSEYRNYLP